MSDYIELGPDDAIRKEDLSRRHGTQNEWTRSPGWIGKKCGEFMPFWEFRRPRSTLIRDAAIALLREVELNLEPHSPVSLLNGRLEDLGKAIGISMEELRGEA